MQLKELTSKQERLLQVIADNVGKKPISKGELLLKAGYSASMAKSPKRILSAFNLQEYIKELGIDKNSRLKRLAMIFNSNKARDVLEANKELSKMLGDYAPTEYNLKAIQDTERKEVFE